MVCVTKNFTLFFQVLLDVDFQDQHLVILPKNRIFGTISPKLLKRAGTSIFPMINFAEIQKKSILTVKS